MLSVRLLSRGLSAHVLLPGLTRAARACVTGGGATAVWRPAGTQHRALCLTVRLGDKAVRPGSSRLGDGQLRRLLALAKPERWRIGGAVILLLVSSAVTMSVPFAVGRLVDVIYRESEDVAQQKLMQICLVLGVVFVVGALANCARIYIMTSTGARVTQRLRTMVFSSILRQEMAFFDATKTGELVNRLASDTTLVSQALTMNISDGLRSAVMAVGGVAMMCYVSTDLALVGLCVVPPVAGFAVIYGKYVKKITKSVQDSLADANAVAEERISNMRTVRAFSGEQRESDRYRRSSDSVLQLCYREAAARAVFFSLNGLSGNAIVVSVLYCGSQLVWAGQVSVGDLSSFLLYAAYVGVAINGLSSFYTELQRGLGATTRLWQLADRRPAVPISGGLRPSRVRGHLRLSQVHFSYPSRPDDTVFSNLSLNVQPGQVLAVVGPSGSGKSTVAWLLLRLYDPRSGHITLDGVDVRQLDPSWLRDQVGLVSQEPTLFSSSIRENILYGAADPDVVSEEQLWEAAGKANATQFIQRLSDGMDTIVGERGVMLSGGQKQRIAIARALLKDPRILILDEATSALDAQSEFLVQTALERVMQGRTVVTIAHRLSTIRRADTVAVLNEGRVAELGTYSELMALPDGLFRRLVHRQTVNS